MNPVDIVNIVIGLIQVLQNIKTSDPANKDIAGNILQTVHQMSPLYELLQRAKNNHDLLEQISIQLENLARGGDAPSLSAAQMLQKSIQSNPLTLGLPDMAPGASNLEKGEFSPALNIALTDLMAVHPNAVRRIQNVARRIDELFLHIDAQNLGLPFRFELVVLCNEVTRARFETDRVIFHLVPILSELFYRLRAVNL